MSSASQDQILRMENDVTRLSLRSNAGLLYFFFASCLFVLSVTAQTPPRQFALKADSPKFWRLFDHKAQLAKVASGFGFTEGPVWDERGFLYVSDEEQNRIFKVFADGRKV